MIKSPYNFVPLSDKIFFPDWADNISHDVPFSDGESGVIKVKMRAESPIFVRNGSKKENETTFSNVNGKYFIPGTSVKGMIRSVLEIMSFGKMQQVDLWTPTYRDLSSGPTGNKYKGDMKNVQCGWLQSSPDSESGYEIIDCGEPLRISHSVLDEKFPELHISFYDLFNKSGNRNNRMDVNSNTDKSAKFKYDLFTDINLKQTCTVKKLKEKDNYKTAVLTKDGSTTGTIVFTGQPGLRDDFTRRGKHLEFVFIDSEESIRLKVSKEVLNNFHRAYYNGEKDESLDWKYWKEQLNSNKCKRIPVFFKKSGEKVLHFGLSYLYKLPYKYGIKKGIENVSINHFSEKPDLAECIFGRIELNDKIGALKGRVQFSHAFAEKGKYREMDEVNTVLGGPKPSYYPLYIQNTDGYNNSNLIIKGRKRYPVHRKNAQMQVYPGTPKTEVRFKPIRSSENNKLVFTCNIRFHNLKKEELGALISALTFYGNSNSLFHSIGLSKGLGYGKVKISIDSIKSNKLSIENLDEYMDSFISIIELSENIKWKEEKSIIELLTMASEQKNQDGSKADLKHMRMNPKAKINDFANAKGHEYLNYYSEIENGIEPYRILSQHEKEQERFEKEKRDNKSKEIDFLSPLAKEIRSKNGSGIKAFITDGIEDNDLEKMNSLLDAYKYLNSDPKSKINSALNKGKGVLFKKLQMIEKKTGRKFRE